MMAAPSDGGGCGVTFCAGPRPIHSAGWWQSRSIPMSILLHAALALSLFGLAVPSPTAPSLPPDAVVVELVPAEAPAEEPPVVAPAPETPAPAAVPAPIAIKAPASRHSPATHHADVPAQRVTSVQAAVPAAAEAPRGDSTPMADADGDADKAVHEAATNTEEGGGAPVPADYLQQVLGRLEGAKRYPATARAAGRQGTVVLRFSIDRTGRLLAWAIERRSGIDALDEEVGDMVQRASPFPAAPDDFPRQQVEMVVPIRFALKS